MKKWERKPLRSITSQAERNPQALTISSISSLIPVAVNTTINGTMVPSGVVGETPGICYLKERRKEKKERKKSIKK